MNATTVTKVHSVYITWFGSTRSGSTWLLVWTQFDPDQLDPNQIDPDRVSSVNAAWVNYIMRLFNHRRKRIRNRERERERKNRSDFLTFELHVQNYSKKLPNIISSSETRPGASYESSACQTIYMNSQVLSLLKTNVIRCSCCRRPYQSTMRVASLRPVLKVFMRIKDFPPLCTSYWRFCQTPTDVG